MLSRAINADAKVLELIRLSLLRSGLASVIFTGLLRRLSVLPDPHPTLLSMSLLSTRKFFTAVLLTVLLLVTRSEAATTLRTYRGVSPYKAIAEGGLYPQNYEQATIVNPKSRRHPKENWDPRCELSLVLCSNN